jgi:cytochrome c5
MARHSSGIRTPKQLIVLVVLAFLVPILTILLITRFVTGGMKADRGDPTMSDEAIAKRLQPIAMIVIKEGGQTDKVAKSGEEVYKQTCAACHATGALNAPKTGDKAAWGPHVKEGLEHLVESAIKGINQMPPRGGNPDLSDLEVARAVVFMANQSGANFKEPAAPKAAEAESEPEKAPAKPAGAPQAESAQAADKPKPAAAAAADKIDGKAIYEKVCAACHATGVAQAPKMGDEEAWAPRLKEGIETLYANAIKGKGAMPPKGGATNLSDAEVKAAVDYLMTR